MTEKKNQIEVSETSEYSVTLPVSPSQFSEFLKELVGAKDRLTNELNFEIELTPQLLTGLIDAIEERIVKQNVSDKIQETYDIIFSDGRSYKLNSLRDLLSISPVSDAISESLTIELVYLVKYPEKVSPSRENITIVFSKLTRHTMNYNIDRGVVGSGSITIEYTERSWAEDISNLFERVLQNGKVDSKIWHLSHYAALREGLPVAAAFFVFISFCVSAYFYVKPFSDISDLSDIEILKSMALSTSPPKLMSSLLILLATGGGLAILAGTMLSSLATYDFSPHKMLLLFEPDINEKERLLKRKRVTFIRSIFVFGTSIVASVLAAYIYEILIL